MYVYFIRAGSAGPIKIGVARSVESRLKTLQTGNHLELRLVTAIKCRDRVDAYNKEAQFHKMFERKRIRGEWFAGSIRINQLSELPESDRQSLENDFACKQSDAELIASCPF